MVPSALRPLRGSRWTSSKETSLIKKTEWIEEVYLALGAKVHAFAGTFWRTTRGMFVPKDHVLVHDPKVEFEGVWLGKPDENGASKHLPLGWVTNVHQWKYSFDEDEKKMHRHEHVDRFTIVQLTGKKITVENRRYYETDEGWWLRDIDSTITDPGPVIVLSTLVGPRSDDSSTIFNLFSSFSYVLLSLLPDLVNLLLDRQVVEAGNRQAQKQANPAIQCHESLAISTLDLVGRTLDRGRIGNAPMRRHRLAGPDWGKPLSPRCRRR